MDNQLANAQHQCRIKAWVHLHEQLTQLDELEGLDKPQDKKLLSALQVVDQYDELCAGIMGKQGRTPSARSVLSVPKCADRQLFYRVGAEIDFS